MSEEQLSLSYYLRKTSIAKNLTNWGDDDLKRKTSLLSTQSRSNSVKNVELEQRWPFGYNNAPATRRSSMVSNRIGIDDDFERRKSIVYDTQPLPVKPLAPSNSTRISYDPSVYANGYENHNHRRTGSIDYSTNYFPAIQRRTPETSYEQVKLDRLNRLLKIVGTTWSVIAVTLAVVSIIGYVVPEQTTGYKCLSCQAKEYYDTVKRECLPQFLFSYSCSATAQCRSDLGLSCRNSKCSCSDTQFWETSVVQCVNLKTYLDTCGASNECEKSLYCTTSSVCNCPLSFTNSSRCDCQRSVGNEWFWNNSTCQAAQSFASQCTNTYMCKTLTENTLCISTLCQCTTLHYFNTGSQKCAPQLLENQPCSLTTDCRMDLGLSCQSGACKCDSTVQFWNGFLCINYYTYNNETCLNDAQCNGVLICRAAGSTCACPSNVALSYCDCPVRVVGTEYYWDGAACSNALAYGIPCSDTYKCRTLTENTFCSGTCTCATLQYFNTVLNKCIAQLMHNVACMLTTDCRVDLGLSCQSGTCLCDTTTQFWNGVQCVNYYTYNTETCTNSTQCNPYKNLICRTSAVTSCVCPSSVTNRCDCPPRVAGNEYFWNGAECELAGVFGDPCTFNYMCQTLTISLQCSSGTCRCGAEGFWNGTSCWYCATGWRLQRNSCFRTSSGELRLHPTIVTGCYSRSDSRLAQFTNSDVTYFRSIFTGDYFYFNGTFVRSTYDASLWSMAPSGADDCVTLFSSRISEHDCAHDNMHGYICEYVLF